MSPEADSSSQKSMELLSFSRLGKEERAEYWASLALRHCSGIGPRNQRKLLYHFGTAFRAIEERNSWGEAGLAQHLAAEFALEKWRGAAKQEWDLARNCDATILLWQNGLYPQRLREIPDAPIILYCQGNLGILAGPVLGMVGSRAASAEGLALAVHFAGKLSACGITICSGMASGIDSAAHGAALDGIGRSIGVLGTGINVIYPESARQLYKRMRSEGLLLAELAPGTAPLARNFPIRNRIISGLSLGVLVVEAASKSGSLITAKLALEQNREVMAIPGQALNCHCRGVQDLVRQGATPVFSVQDVLQDLFELLRPYKLNTEKIDEKRERKLEEVAPASLNAKRGETQSSTDNTPNVFFKNKDKPFQSFCAEEPKMRLLGLLQECGSLHSDELAERLSLPINKINALLVEMELFGEVRRLPGSHYSLP